MPVLAFTSAIHSEEMAIGPDRIGTHARRQHQQRNSGPETKGRRDEGKISPYSRHRMLFGLSRRGIVLLRDCHRHLGDYRGTHSSAKDYMSANITRSCGCKEAGGAHVRATSVV